MGIGRQLNSMRGPVLLAVAFGLSASPVQATRGILIDDATYEIWADAGQGDHVALPFPVNFGSGPQSSVTVQLPTNFSTNIGGRNYAVVGLTFPGAPAASLFATVGGTSNYEVPGLRLSNETEASTPTRTVPDASIFQFGKIIDPSMSPPRAGSPDCSVAGGGTYCYGPMINSALFQFTKLASSGSTGNFDLHLECSAWCGNIGFDLGGVSFSADDFNPADPPTQLAKYSVVQSGDTYIRSWDFIFRNAAGVPEPSTWLSMLIGFGLIGIAVRSQRGRQQAS